MSFDDRPFAFASHNRHDNSSRVDALEPGTHPNAELGQHSIRNVDFYGVVGNFSHRQVLEGVRMKVRAVPRVEAIGHNIGWLAPRFNIDHCCNAV
jgi:hypothetical protein